MMRIGYACFLLLSIQIARAQALTSADVRVLSDRWAVYYATLYRVPIELVLHPTGPLVRYPLSVPYSRSSHVTAGPGEVLMRASLITCTSRKSPWWTERGWTGLTLSRA